MQDYIPIQTDINGNIPVIEVKQYDHMSRHIVVKIFDDDLPDGSAPLDITGCEARLYLYLANDDDVLSFIDCEVADGEAGKVAIDIPNGATQIPGDYRAELVITDPTQSPEETTTISSREFTLRVIKSVRDPIKIEATGQFSAFENGLNNIGYLKVLAAFLSARIDALAQLTDGSTTGDAELIDGRIGFDGSTHANIGNAIRSQIAALASCNPIDIIALLPKTSTPENQPQNGVYYNWTGNRCYVHGEASGSGSVNNIFNSSNSLPYGLTSGQKCYLKFSGTNVRFNVAFYINGAIDNSSVIYTYSDQEITIPENAAGMRIRLWVNAGTNVDETIMANLLTDLTCTERAEASITNTGFLPSSDLDNLSGNICCLLISTNTYTHAPFNIGTVFNLVFSSNLSVQLGYDFTNGDVMYRRYSTTWGNWKRLTPPGACKTGKKYVAFGDSLSYGAVWNATRGGSIHQVKEAWRIPTRIALATGMYDNFSNEAIGGIGYVKQVSGDNLVSLIADYDFSDVELVTIMAGANDKYDYQLGTYSDSAAAETVCGAIRNIIQTIAASNPKTQIIIIQPTPSAVNGNSNDVWSTVPSGFRWSMNQFDEQVSQLCYDEHVTYLNWWDSAVCRNWKYVGYNGSTKENYTHPTEDFDYCMLGDFIGGKVSAVFKGLS